jgi:GNAT superfamily N-acetyltransferase
MSGAVDLQRRACTVRRARRDDLPALVALCAAHADYERADYAPAGKAQRLERVLFAASPRLHAWVASGGDGLVGYATAATEFSTWTAGEFLHMDCLYVRDGERGAGIGAALLQAVLRFARAQGIAQVQWQTPAWNRDAARFYRRHGALGSDKTRFVMDLPAAGPGWTGHHDPTSGGSA